MAVLPIVIVPDARLKTKARPVTSIDTRIRRLMDDMLETMYAAPGIGLAAPQVGVLERVVVLDVADKDEPAQPMRMVNPEILWASEDRVILEQEGCLSIPDLYADVARPEQIRMRYLDEKGETREIEADGLLARCIQHEIDHLDGILFIDHLSKLKRDMFLRKMQKVKRAGS
ncbi:MAG TPA: peptide deformylase [Azospirillaceae bacterium]|nr:peptide deformylase [Azospirillaceae bacterium]